MGPRYNVILAEYTCLRLTTQLHRPLKEYKALGTPLQLYGHVVTVLHPFKLPNGLTFGYMAIGGVVESLRRDACRVVMP